MTRAAFVIVLSFILISCVATPASRFPGFAEQAKNITGIDVLVDVVVSEDLKGSSLGIDLERNRLVVTSVKDEIEWMLRDKGYVVNSIHVNGGLFVDWEELAEEAKEIKAPGTDELQKDSVGKNTDDSEIREGGPEAGAYYGPPLVFIENEEITGVAVEGPFLDPDAQPWTRPDVRAFLIGLHEQSNKFYFKKVAEGEAFPSLLLDQVPDALSNLTSNTLLIIRINATEVRGETSAAVGIATGLLTLIISGGTIIAGSTVVDGHITEAMLVDTRDKEILWYNNVQHLGTEETNYEVVRLLDPLTSTGLNLSPLLPENSGDTAESDPELVSVFDLTGEYQSEITGGNVAGWLFTNAHRNTKISITQSGNQIKAKFGPNGTIEGRVEGDKAYFNWYTTTEGTGEWRINAASNRLTGSWETKAWSSNGQWSMTKIGEPLKMAQYSRSASNLSADSGLDISGSYVSEITTSYQQGHFKTRKQRSMRLEIKQDGNQFVAENEEFDLKIIGTRDGNNIRFYALPNKITQYEITGEWNLTPDNSRIKGRWDLKGSGYNEDGEWNLKKVE